MSIPALYILIYIFPFDSENPFRGRRTKDLAVHKTFFFSFFYYFRQNQL